VEYEVDFVTLNTAARCSAFMRCGMEATAGEESLESTVSRITDAMQIYSGLNKYLLLTTHLFLSPLSRQWIRI
jgi:hypothetical protein